MEHAVKFKQSLQSVKEQWTHRLLFKK